MQGHKDKYDSEGSRGTSEGLFKNRTAAMLAHAQYGRQHCLLFHEQGSSNACSCDRDGSIACACITRTVAMHVHAQQGQQQCMFMHDQDSSNACSGGDRDGNIACLCIAWTAAMLADA